MNIYPREFYLKKLRPFYKSDLIKVVSGIRRCGKSCLLLSVAEELKALGVPTKDIIYLNLDKRGLKNVKTASQLEKVIDAAVIDDDFKYLFIDEIQNVEDFEAVINAYREEGNFSIFITGSNSYLLSGELVTKLTGRYIEIGMFTLSFYEFLEMKRFLGKRISANLAEEFNEYLKSGGFPKTLEFDEDEAKATYLGNVIEQILLKDVKGKRKIRNRIVFDKVRTYFVNNFGTMLSLENIENYFNNQEKTKVKRDTLKRYLQILEDARILYRCPRFDMKSKKSLRGEGKFYLADTGIYFATNTDGRINYGPILENVLYVYLKSRGYEVSVGRIGELECDFIARKNDEYRYIQVAMTIMNNRDDDRSTEEREYRPLETIRDSYPKYLFTLDTLLQKRNGIKHLNLIDFIAKGDEL